MLNQETIKKIQEFYSNAMKYLGKEICLPSKQEFQIRELVKNKNDEASQQRIFYIQYGWPSSGSVFLKVIISKEEGETKAYIDEITINTQPPEKQIITSNNVLPIQDPNLPEIGIQIGGIINTGTQEYSGEQIEENPNAMWFLNMAKNDLKAAEVIGPCYIDSHKDDDEIWWCNSASERPDIDSDYPR